MSERDAVRRLVQRVGLGARAGGLDTAVAAGFDATLATLLAPAPDPGADATPPPDLGLPARLRGGDAATRRARRQAEAERTRGLGVWWLDRMTAVDRPFAERMAWFWHGHFATSARKVRSAALMYGQNATLRRLGTGDFRVLAQAMVVDPAMLIWLDGGGNTVGRPNENLAREFMELFTLGIGTYSENDVREAARALTGWRVDVAAGGSAAFTLRDHDGGPKTVLGTTAPLDAPGLVDLLVGRPESARFLAARVWARFVAHTPPDPAALDALAGAYGPARDVTALVRAAVTTPAFRDEGSVLVRQPVEWLVAALRALRMRASAVPAAALRSGLTGLGQVPFLPPDVGGWPGGSPWLTTASALSRLRLARALAGAGDPGAGRRRGPRRARRRGGGAAGSARFRRPDGCGAGPARGPPARPRGRRAGEPGERGERMTDDLFGGRRANRLTRRRFLLASGAAAVAAAGAGVGWAELHDRIRTDPLPAGSGVLVIVTLYGGNDGLGTVVPAADPAYQDARPDLAYAEHEVLDLGDGLGLNPGMPGLKGQWDAGTLAIVRGAGYPAPDHSHFRSMDIWQTASPQRPSSTGWIGRWLDGAGRDPLLAVSLEPVLPPLLAGATTAGATLPLRGLALPRGPLGTAFAAMGGVDVATAAGAPDPRALAARAITDLHRTVDTLGPALEAPDDAADADRPAVAGGDTAPDADGGVLASQLDVVARCVERGAPTRVYSVSLGGFDTHADERGTQQQLLTQVDAAVSGFLGRMAGTDRGRQVVVLVYSEFGRRVAANANQGTDHGTAGPMLVAGVPVRGGFVGAQPGLTDLDDGDLRFTTDFRDVYATLLSGVLGADPEPVLGPGRTTLPLLAT